MGRNTRGAFLLPALPLPDNSVPGQSVVLVCDEADGRFKFSENGGAFQPVSAAVAAGWTDDGGIVRLTSAGDQVAIGIATVLGAEKLRVYGSVHVGNQNGLDGITVDAETAAGADLPVWNVQPLPRSSVGQEGRAASYGGGAGAVGDNLNPGGEGGIGQYIGGRGGAGGAGWLPGNGGATWVFGGVAGSDGGAGGANGGPVIVKGGPASGAGTVGGDIQIDGGTGTTPGDVAIGGTSTANLVLGGSPTQPFGVYGGGPVPRAAAYSVTNPVDRRAFDTATVTLQQLAEVVGTLIADDQALGLRG